MSYEHWHRHNEDGVCWLEFDRKGKSANAINLDVLLELEQIVSELEKEKDVKKLIICSKKKSGFIAGADIVEIFSVRDQEKTNFMIHKGQEVFFRIEKLPFPTIALIHGFCLGGGFELALACDWRIAIDDGKTKIGLPEVRLGIQPGWGGSVRSMRLTSPLNVFDFILTGKTLNAKKAKKLGLIDEAVPQRVVHQALAQYNTKRKLKTPLISKLLNIPFIRPFIAQLVYNQVSSKTSKEHYPAPFAMIDNWKRVGHMGMDAYKEELRSIIELSQNKTTEHLVDIFMMQDRAKKNPDMSSEKIKHLHVIGGGVMGGDIAGWGALRGLKVTLQDVNLKNIQASLKRTYKLAKKQLDADFKVQEVMDRIVVDIHGKGIADADIIIEAVNENLELKRAILSNVNQHSRPDAIIATNTSTIPLEKLDDIFGEPGRFVGVHFFNPVSQMPLVEIVEGENSSPLAISVATKFVQQIDKYPLVVKSASGFLVNRILLPYLVEALKLHQEGHSMESIDQAALSFGMPMGPIELADTVGLDVCLAAFASLKGEDSTVSALLQKKIQDKHLGKKTGEGFYHYKDGKPIKKTKVNHDDLLEIQSRLVLMLCNEAISAWADGIVQTKDDMNAGSIFGFGFPPFRGGIMTYILETGPSIIKEQLQQMSLKLGDRFIPHQAWDEIA